MKTLIISNGDIKDYEVLKNEASKVDFIVCADGGAKHLFKANLKPDVIVGDLDSITNEALGKYREEGIKFVKFPAKKDNTDTDLAIDYALQKGANEIVLLGATGTRIDHTLANIFLLYKLLKKGVKAKIIDSHNEIYITDNKLKISKDINTFVSIIPFLGDVEGVTLKGFEYETNNIDIKFSSTLGISNKVISDKGKVKIKDGVCLVIKSRD
ncbi:thiamine diphosphokinase [Thermohalobacter berrensis]|uniref:Thiamine diphosphokinase n=1 Tax=Thermohalobacter berrensis TaxID=99594 RepID=A0A419TA66_9FIRM|nr:thiamine diphosphokinase [Thermohalobacter berrensis]RKD34370.1 thiamine diphosphokinase [Thermohalobacter berrensis]